MKKIAIGSDHAGYALKKSLIKHLEANGYGVTDYGTDSEERADYPDFAHPVADAIERKDFEYAVLVCGSANGISMTANKHQGVRCAICWQPEIAILARAHNDANIISFPARFISLADATIGLDNFLGTEFEGGRHSLRVDKINR
ncbi:MAG: ribose 5-phosphate isomerase B [Pseudomonadales bacterium]|nr:ribose 5-phosphate isomerase B [Pseudomonadales bacterium]